jgi:hypothetical protein
MANRMHWHKRQVVLMLCIGVLLVVRSVVQSVFLVVGIDILAIIGIVLLCSGFVVAYHLRGHRIT